MKADSIIMNLAARHDTSTVRYSKWESTWTERDDERFGGGGVSAETFNRLGFLLLESDGKWALATTIPKMGDVRGGNGEHLSLYLCLSNVAIFVCMLPICLSCDAAK